MLDEFQQVAGSIFEGWPRYGLGLDLGARIDLATIG